MTAREWRYLLLVLLAWDLWELRRSAMTVVRSYGEPVLYLTRRTGDTLPIMAKYEDDRWFYTLGRTSRVEANRQAARRIASMVT